MAKKITNHISFKAGKGETVVFLHGIEEDGTFWFPLDRAVAEYRHVLSPDLLGYGKSVSLKGTPYTKHEHVEALLNTLKDQGISTPVVLVGHSLGCYVAMGFAAKYPKMVSRIILLSPVVILKDEDIERGDLQSNATEDVLESVGAIRKFFISLAKSDKADPEVKATLRNFDSSTKNIKTLVEKQDFPGDLKKNVKLPIEIAYGAIDPLIVPENLKYLKTIKPDLKIKKLPSGHDVVHAQPVEIFKMVVRGEKVPDVIYKKLWRR